MIRKLLPYIVVINFIIIGYLIEESTLRNPVYKEEFEDLEHRFCSKQTLVTVKRALYFFETVCQRRPTEQEGLDVLEDFYIENCPNYGYKRPLIRKTELTNLVYLNGINQKPVLKYIESSPYLVYPGNDKKMNTEDDILVSLR